MVSISREGHSDKSKRAGLQARVPASKPLVLKCSCGTFARQYVAWTCAQWDAVNFRQEFKFNLLGSDGNTYLWSKAVKYCTAIESKKEQIWWW